MAKWLRVRRPLTTNGKTQRIDENDKVMYNESFLPVAALEDLKAINAVYEDALKMKIDIVNYDPVTGKVYSDEEAAKTETKGGRKKLSEKDIDDALGLTSKKK